MKFRLKYFVLVYTLCTTFYLAAQQQAIELVESIPDETTLGNPDIRNTKEVWLELIRGARLTLDIETFYVSDKEGEPLADIISAISDAAKRGVYVRIISDSKFYKTYPQTLDQLKGEKNVEVRIINFAKAGGGIMHAKYFIVNGSTAFIGSQNFDWRSLKHIHEIGVVFRNEQIAKSYLQVFNLDWNYCESGKKDETLSNRGSAATKIPIQVMMKNSSAVFITPTYSPVGFIPDETYSDEAAITTLIGEAKKEICIQVMSYSAQGHDRKTYYDKIENALRNAAARGVKIKFIAADWSTSKPKIDYLKSLAVLPNIDVKISTIPQHSGGFVTFARVEHCKYMTIDNRISWIGTSNWEEDYFRYSRNVGAVIESDLFASQLREVFRKSWESTYTQPVRCDQKYTVPRRDDGSGE